MQVRHRRCTGTNQNAVCSSSLPFLLLTKPTTKGLFHHLHPSCSQGLVPGIQQTEVLRAIEAESQPLGRKPGLGGSYGNMFQMDVGLLGAQRLGLHQGLSCTLGMGRGGCCPRGGMGGTSVSLQATRVGEGLLGAKGQAPPSLGTLPGGREEPEIIRVFSQKSAFIRNQRPRILHHLNGLRSEN